MKKIMLYSAVLVALLAGCKSKDPQPLGLNPEKVEETRAAIRSTIPEAERAAKMVAIVDDFAAEAKRLATKGEAIQQKIVEANRDYSTTREQMEAMYAELVGIVEQLGNCVRDHSLHLRGLCSPSEWEIIAKQFGDNAKFEF